MNEKKQPPEGTQKQFWQLTEIGWGTILDLEVVQLPEADGTLPPDDRKPTRE
jgi:hypothetical protein